MDEKEETGLVWVPHAFRFGAILVKAAMWVAIAYFSADTIQAVAESLAGKITYADLKLDAEGLVQIPACEKAGEILDKSCWVTGWFGVLLFVSGLGYGVRQRNLRRINIERLTKRVRELEQCCDDGRSSSGLTPRGETNPGDR